MRTKNYQSLMIGLQVPVENVRDAFLGHSVHVQYIICSCHVTYFI